MKVTGVGSIPASAEAVAAVIHVYNLPVGSAGYLAAWKSDPSDPNPTPQGGDITWVGETSVSATVLVPVDANGYITVLSTSAANVSVQVVGYYQAATKTYRYTYAPDGLRSSKIAPDGTTTKFTWDRSGPLPLLLVEKVDVPGGTAGDIEIRYLYGPGSVVIGDALYPAGGTPSSRAYHYDQLGSMRALTNGVGAVVGSVAYTPYGELATQTGSTTPIGFAGEYRDSETGLTYLRARYYDAPTGQFLTRDPIEAVTRSAYAYVGNNPSNATDPTGLFCVGDLCTDGITDAIDGAWDYGYEVTTDAIDDTADFAYRNRGTIATIGAAGTCLIPAVGLAACGYAAAAAFVVRAEQRVGEHGFSNSLGANLTDGALTYLTFGLGGAFEALGGPWAGVAGVSALERSALLSYLGRLIPSGYDITNLFGWLEEQC